MSNYISWNIAKDYVHDASGVEKPENYTWYLFKGIYYPNI